MSTPRYAVNPPPQAYIPSAISGFAAGAGVGGVYRAGSLIPGLVPQITPQAAQQIGNSLGTGFSTGFFNSLGLLGGPGLKTFLQNPKSGVLNYSVVGLGVVLVIISVYALIKNRGK